MTQQMTYDDFNNQIGGLRTIKGKLLDDENTIIDNKGKTNSYS